MGSVQLTIPIRALFAAQTQVPLTNNGSRVAGLLEQEATVTVSARIIAGELGGAMPVPFLRNA